MQCREGRGVLCDGGFSRAGVRGDENALAALDAHRESVEHPQGRRAFAELPDEALGLEYGDRCR